MKRIVSTPLFLLVAGSLACGSALAQVKADGMWRGSGGAAASLQSGNSDSTALALNLDMVNASVSDRISLGGSYNYGRSKVDGVSTTNTDKWAGYGQYDYNLSKALYVFGKLGAEGDKLAHLDLRGTLAGGVGYKLIDTETMSFNLFGGAAYSRDKYGVDQTIGDKTGKTFSRTSLLLGEESSHQLSTATSFKQRLELYPGLTGDKARIAKFSAGLAVAMSSAINLTVGLTDSYNSRPPEGNKKNDIGLFTGINVKLGAP
jgi:putative salt-induced outer membrane protein